MTPRATSSRSTMSSTSGMPRAATPNSARRAPKVRSYELDRHERPGLPGRFRIRRSDGRRGQRELCGVKRHEEIVGAKRLFQADHILEARRVIHEIERGHS